MELEGGSFIPSAWGHRAVNIPCFRSLGTLLVSATLISAVTCSTATSTYQLAAYETESGLDFVSWTVTADGDIGPLQEERIFDWSINLLDIQGYFTSAPDNSGLTLDNDSPARRSHACFALD